MADFYKAAIVFRTILAGPCSLSKEMKMQKLRGKSFGTNFITKGTLAKHLMRQSHTLCVFTRLVA